MTDLHVTGTAEQDGDSWINVATPAQPEHNPFDALLETIENQKLAADVLLCCGDMADKASFAGQQHAWTRIHEIAKALKTKSVIATAGNHDLDSRYANNDFDPKSNLQMLAPTFPVQPEVDADRFWSRNYAIVEHEHLSARVLILNSCAFHGYGRENQEFLHGRVSPNTIMAIKRELERQKRAPPFNIALMHHHPMRWDIGHEEDYSEMIGGDRLIELLGSGDYGSWIIVHGHKHVPNICYASGGADSPIVFSAGSFSSKRLDSSARSNEFYILTLENDVDTALGLDFAGTVRSWSWSLGSGWHPIEFKSNIPDRAGFGARESISSLAKKIGAIVEQTEPYLAVEEMHEQLPLLRYCLPSDLKSALRKAQEKYDVKITHDEFGRPSQFSIDKVGEG